ncbi:MAG: hypothetical protein KKC77_19825 [Proteobacteria bacterium]|nr:hypothetical protein [Pseudomonadota bacterium]
MGQNQFIIAVALSVMFSIAFLSFATNFATEQDAVISIANDGEMSGLVTYADADAISFTDGVNDSEVSFSQSSIEETSQSGTLVTGSAFKTLGPVGTLKNIVSVGYVKIFGGDSGFNSILYLLMGTILTIGIFLMWKTWKGGNPD